MRNQLFQILIGLLFVTTIIACKQDATSSGEVEQNLEQETEEVATSGDELASYEESVKDIVVKTPEISIDTKKEIEEIKKNAEKSSTFSKLGCCAKEMQKTKDGCCCSEVLVKYRSLRAENSKLIADIKAKDPIYNDCKKIMSKEFECVDYPESCLPKKKSEETEEDDYNDLI